MAYEFRACVKIHLLRGDLVAQAVDLQPEEPAIGAQHSGHMLLRERLLRFNVAVLRVVAAACAGLPHSKQVKVSTLPPPELSQPVRGKMTPQA
jgi:hypothetical protein